MSLGGTTRQFWNFQKRTPGILTERGKVSDGEVGNKIWCSSGPMEASKIEPEMVQLPDNICSQRIASVLVVEHAYACEVPDGTWRAVRPTR